MLRRFWISFVASNDTWRAETSYRQLRDSLQYFAKGVAQDSVREQFHVHLDPLDIRHRVEWPGTWDGELYFVKIICQARVRVNGRRHHFRVEISAFPHHTLPSNLDTWVARHVSVIEDNGFPHCLRGSRNGVFCPVHSECVQYLLQHPELARSVIAIA